MTIKYFIKKKNGNVVIETNEGIYEIANNADNGQPYGICLPNTDIYISITKGAGKNKYNSILKEIEKNKAQPVFEEHYFTPSESDSNFCGKCNQYFTHNVHFRQSNVHPLFNNILNAIHPVS